MNFAVTGMTGYGAFFQLIQSGETFGRVTPQMIDTDVIIDFLASRYSETYGASDTVMPASVDMKMGIYLGQTAQV